MSNNLIDLSTKTPVQGIFLKKFDNVIRVDNISSRRANILKENSEGNTWFSKELNYESDKTRFSELPEVPKRMFQLNIGYQTIMDSGVSNGYLDTIRKICSDPIWKIVYTRIGMEEVIHAESYSYALNQIFNHNAEEFLDVIYKDPVILKRMDNEIDAFSKMDDNIKNYGVTEDTIPPEVMDEYKKDILNMLLSAYLLEGIKFPFSFFVSWTINKAYDNCIQGISRLLKLIAHDEFTFHIGTHLQVFQALKTQDSHGFKYLFENGYFKNRATELAKIIQDQELDWNKYLLKDGDIPFYNENIGTYFIKYWTNKRLIDLGIDPIEDIPENDIINWYNSYRDLNKSNTALQEASNTNYQKGGLSNDLEDL